jgi:hypothetical protein
MTMDRLSRALQDFLPKLREVYDRADRPDGVLLVIFGDTPAGARDFTRATGVAVPDGTYPVATCLTTRAEVLLRLAVEFPTEFGRGDLVLPPYAPGKVVAVATGFGRIKTFRLVGPAAAAG